MLESTIPLMYSWYHRSCSWGMCVKIQSNYMYVSPAFAPSSQFLAWACGSASLAYCLRHGYNVHCILVQWLQGLLLSLLTEVVLVELQCTPTGVLLFISNVAWFYLYLLFYTGVLGSIWYCIPSFSHSILITHYSMFMLSWSVKNVNNLAVLHAIVTEPALIDCAWKALAIF